MRSLCIITIIRLLLSIGVGVRKGSLAEIPRALYNKGFNYLGSDRFVEDASFMRLNYLSLGYSLDPKLLRTNRCDFVEHQFECQQSVLSDQLLRCGSRDRVWRYGCGHGWSQDTAFAAVYGTRADRFLIFKMFTL